MNSLLLLRSLIYGLRDPAAHLVRGTPLSSFVSFREGEQCFFLKKRRGYLPFLIALWNIYCAAAGIEVRMLSLARWRQWEKRAYRELYGLHIESTGSRWLRMPYFNGPSLMTVLKRDDIPVAQKMDAFTHALQELARLHGTTLEYPDGTVTLFSHSDANAGNVVILDGKAQWIDFEMLHSPSLPVHLRHADDLRALSFCAAACLDECHFEQLAEALMEGYQNREGLLGLRSMLEERIMVDSFFHQVQTRIPWDRAKCWETALMQRLPRSN